MDEQTDGEYVTEVWYSDEDGCYIARVTNVDWLKHVSAFGQTEKEALTELGVVLAGCSMVRISQLEARIQELQTEVAELEAEVTEAYSY